MADQQSITPSRGKDNYELVATPEIGKTYFFKKFDEDSYTEGKLLSSTWERIGMQEYINQYMFDTYKDKVDQVYIKVNRGGKSRRKKLRKSKKRRSYRKKI